MMSDTLLASNRSAAGIKTDSREFVAVKAVLDKARAEGRAALIAPEARAVCEAYGIKVPSQDIVGTADEAAAAAARIGFPVALKIVSKDILHKTEAGGVLLGLKTLDEVKQGFTQVMKNSQSYNSAAKIDGVQVQRMVSGDREVIVGAVTDPSFGKAGRVWTRRHIRRSA